MKAISLWQPWASAIALDLKHFETRGWRPPEKLVGQLLAIHAAKRKDETGVWRWMQHNLNIQPGQTPEDFDPAALDQVADSFHALPFGAIVCIVRVEAVFQVSHRPSVLKHIGENEEKWGDYGEGRYYWQLKLIYKLDQAIPCVGRQGIFDWQIPDEWMKAEADRVGQPGMFEIWKAVNGGK